MKHILMIIIKDILMANINSILAMKSTKIKSTIDNWKINILIIEKIIQCKFRIIYKDQLIIQINMDNKIFLKRLFHFKMSLVTLIIHVKTKNISNQKILLT